MRHWPLNWQWPRCLELGWLHVSIQALCTVQMSGKCSFLWITGRFRMYVSPVRWKTRLPHSASSRVKAESQAFPELRTRENGSHWHGGARGATFSVLGETPRWFHFFPPKINPLSLGGAALGTLWWSSIREKETSEPEVTAGALDTRTPDRQLSRQPKVKPPVLGAPELYRISFTKQGTTGTVYTKQRVLPLGHLFGGPKQLLFD